MESQLQDNGSNFEKMICKTTFTAPCLHSTMHVYIPSQKVVSNHKHVCYKCIISQHLQVNGKQNNAFEDAYQKSNNKNKLVLSSSRPSV